jgi:heavy metal sensor kinase
MRSIRWSLVVYFLILMGATLGAVSYFCYQSTQSALETKEKYTKAFLTKKFEDDKVHIVADFDMKLFRNARELGKKLILHYHRVEPLYAVTTVGSAPPLVGLWNILPAAESLVTEPTSLIKAVAQMRLRADPRIQPLHPDDDHLFPPLAIEEGEFYQTYLMLPFPMKGGPKQGKDMKAELLSHEASENLGGLAWQLGKEQKQKADDPVQRPFDEIRLKSGQIVRRVTLRVPVDWQRIGVAINPLPTLTAADYLPLNPLGGQNALRWESSGTVQIAKGPRPFIYLQYGLDTAERDRALENAKTELESRLVQLSDDLSEARAQLGRQLLWVSLGAFAALVAGGLCLVSLGLSPLNRLSEAVSKVSEKDFRLPIDQDHLPRELVPIADRLSQTLDQLKRVFEREKQAAADISHELRTPVAALLTTLDITLRKQRSADEYREVLEECRSSGKQINQLVERLLTLARLNAGADMLRPREVDVNALTDQCVALVRPLAEARGLQIRVHHNGPASMNADPDKLREVLTNLLHNAIEYNKPDGSIDVKVERNNGTMAMEVRDTGIGISADARERIFERFYRADPSRHADDTPHAGLGLAIVKGYVDLMGGSIDVDSTVGTGSTFRVRLPVL